MTPEGTPKSRDHEISRNITKPDHEISRNITKYPDVAAQRQSLVFYVCLIFGTMFDDFDEIIGFLYCGQCIGPRYPRLTSWTCALYRSAATFCKCFEGGGRGGGRRICPRFFFYPSIQLDVSRHQAPFKKFKRSTMPASSHKSPGASRRSSSKAKNLTFLVAEDASSELNHFLYARA